MAVELNSVPASRIAGWRLFLYGFAIVVLLAAMLLSAGAAIGQASANNSLGCWGLLTNGGNQRSTALNRIRDETTFVGGSMSSASNKVLINTYSILNAWRPITGPAQPPIQNTTTNYMPLAMNAWNFPLTLICS